jgi:predicted aldo/keto reductase-like oxidoreductase
MIYRTLGRTGAPVGVIGLGCEYLINQPASQIVSVVREALDAGVNYFDLFYAQPAIRNAYGEALAGRRHQVMVAGHLGASYQDGPDGQYARTRDLAVSEAYIHDLLRRLRTDYLDVLFLHNCDEPDDYEVVITRHRELAERFRQQGKARYLGFSSHTPATALRAVTSGAVEVLMFPIHLLEHAQEERTALLSACVEHNVGVVAMKPYAGGKILQEHASAAVTPVACLSYALAQFGVATVVPGAANLAQLRDALHYLDATAAERDFSPALRQLGAVGATSACVYCNHCLPCPVGIDIGAVTRALDLARRGAQEAARQAYARLATPASDCLQCGDCASRCPWHLDPPAAMAAAAALLE